MPPTVRGPTDRPSMTRCYAVSTRLAQPADLSAIAAAGDVLNTVAVSLIDQSHVNSTHAPYLASSTAFRYFYNTSTYRLVYYQ